MSVENKIKELLERVDAKASLEEAGMMGASGVSKDSSIKPAKSGDSGAPKQGDSKDATYETRDEKEANQGAQVSKGIKKNDIQINEILRRFNTMPVFVICRVQDTQQIGLPTTAYFTREEIDQDGNLKRQFVHIASSIGATHAEEVGVEHLLRDIKDAS